MTKVLGQYAQQTYALMRIVAGFMFACHGAQKLFGVLGYERAALASMQGVGGIIEFFGGVLIMIGLFTGLAAFICSGEMAVAYFMVHQGGGLLPIQNQGELPALYAFVFLVIATHGAGIWSVDGSRSK